MCSFPQRLEEIMRRTRRTESADKVLAWPFLATLLFCGAGSHVPRAGLTEHGLEDPTSPAPSSQVQGTLACAALALTVLDVASFFSQPHPLGDQTQVPSGPREHSTTGMPI